MDIMNWMDIMKYIKNWKIAPPREKFLDPSPIVMQCTLITILGLKSRDPKRKFVIFVLVESIFRYFWITFLD